MGHTTAAVAGTDAASPAQATAQDGDIPSLSQPLHGMSHGALSCAVIASSCIGTSANAATGLPTSATQSSALMNRVANLRTSCIAINLVYTVQVAPTLTRKTVKGPRNVIDLLVEIGRPGRDKSGKKLLVAVAVMQVRKMRMLVP